MWSCLPSLRPNGRRHHLVPSLLPYLTIVADTPVSFTHQCMYVPWQVPWHGPHPAGQLHLDRRGPVWLYACVCMYAMCGKSGRAIVLFVLSRLALSVLWSYLISPITITIAPA